MISDTFSLQPLAVIGVDIELTVPIDVRKMSLDRTRILPAPGYLDHYFRHAPDGSCDLVKLPCIELQRRVATAPAIAHYIQLSQSSRICNLQHPFRHRLTPNL